jgi:hypothetical protein
VAVTVYCNHCDNVCASTRKQSPRWWKCIKVQAQLKVGYKYVSDDYAPDPPYAFCENVNQDGKCSMFTPLRKPKEEAA